MCCCIIVPAVGKETCRRRYWCQALQACALQCKTGEAKDPLCSSWALTAFTITAMHLWRARTGIAKQRLHTLLHFMEHDVMAG